MPQDETLQDALDAAICSVMLALACEAVAEQGVEIHQWLRDEKARRRTA